MQLRHRREEVVNLEEDEEDWMKDGERKLPLFVHGGLESLFGFNFTDMDSVLLASYVCVLPNKGESRFMHGDLQIVSKMVKQAYKWVDKGRKSVYTSFEKPMAPPETIGDFEFDPHSVATGAHLYKIRVARLANFELADWDSEMEKRIATFCLRAVISELSTTKGSTRPFDPDLDIRFEEDDAQKPSR